MFKLIILVLGLAVGFGGGVYWGVHHPDQAATLSAQEEVQMISAQEKLTQKVNDLVAKQQQQSIAGIKVPGSGFLGGGSTPSTAVDPDLKDLQAQAQSQLDGLKAKLAKISH